ncbi:synaptotagmin-15-like isoform X2 [Paramacrobiotus metropolitanus]|uniref:synaptotagmin-15-like isoform X2 n=1 Tax=Paramacrobiotus metropolitanus TaxID=2943436 RepID=UPI00244635B2|nr:synaptotagmin-15-like isoform X2 [Paramacrobiotus metropolitanus]
MFLMRLLNSYSNDMINVASQNPDLFYLSDESARGFTNSLDVSPVAAKFDEIRSYSFGSATQYIRDRERDGVGRNINLNVIPPFVLPTRDNCPISPGTRKRMSLQNFGTINPALYSQSDSDENMSFPEGHQGRLWFQLAYERDSEKLICTVVKARNLPCRADKSQCDPFVRLSLLPDERRTLQTKVKRKTCDPRFEESFVFPISAKTINERILRFSVYDIDRRKKHVLIGHAFHSLCDFNVALEHFPVTWKDLHKEATEVENSNSVRGELLVSLCYNDDIQRLTVNIIEGKSLHSKEKASGTEAFVKVSLMHQSRLLKRYKTQLVQCKPEDDGVISFCESFQFKLLSRMCEAVSLVILAETRNKLTKEKRAVGRVILGGLMFARGKELEHWQECMQKEKEHVQEWHTLVQM